EVDALTFLRDKTDRSGAVLVSPDPVSHLRFPNFPLKPYLSVFIPGFTGHPVYNGHWSETAAYGRKFTEMIRFFDSQTDDIAREAFLHEKPIRYILYANTLGNGIPPFPNGNVVQDRDTPYIPVDWRENTPLYLKVLYGNAEITVYEVE